MKMGIWILAVWPYFAPLSAQITPTSVRLDAWMTAHPTGVLGKLPLALDERVWAMKFSADGREILTVTDSICRIPWPHGRPQTIWQPGPEQTLDRAFFSPDGSHFARAENGDRVHIHETSTGQLLQTFDGRTPRFTAVAWSNDGKQIAVGVGPEIVIHDIGQTSPPNRRIHGGKDVSTLAWSPDARWLAVATQDDETRKGSVFLIDLRGDGKKPVQLPGDDRILFSFSPDSERLAVAGEENSSGMLILWDIPNQKQIARIRCQGGNDLAHSPDGGLLVTCGLNELRILSARDLTDIARREADSINNHIHSIAFSPDGSLLATGVENRVRIRDTRTWEEIHPDDVLRAPVNALAFSADGKHLISGGWNGDLVLWDWWQKTPVWKKFAAPRQWHIQALSVDPASRWIGVVQHPQHPETRAIRLVHFNSGEPHLFLEPEAGAIAAPLFTPSGKTALVACPSHELLETDCETGQILRRLPIRFLKESESGKYGVIDTLAFDSSQPDLIRWTAENQAAGRFHLQKGVTGDTIESRHARDEIEITPPRTHEFLTHGERVLNLPSLRLATFPRNSDELPNVRHPSGLLYLWARGGTVSVCDILSQSIITHFDFGPGRIDALAVSPDGLVLVAATTGGLLYRSLEGPPVAQGTSLETLWNLMGSENHWMAHQAAWALAKKPDFVAFLETKMAPARKPSAQCITRIKARLVDGSHEVRQAAAREWLDLGFGLDDTTLATLGQGAMEAKWPQAMPTGWDSELFPSGSMIGRVKPVPPLIPLSAHRQAMRAVMILSANRSDDSQGLLDRLAEGDPSAPLTIACRRSRK